MRAGGAGAGAGSLNFAALVFSYYFIINYSRGFVVARFLVFLFPVRPFDIARSRRGEISAGAPCAPKKRKERKMPPMKTWGILLWTFLAKNNKNESKCAFAFPRAVCVRFLGCPTIPPCTQTRIYIYNLSRSPHLKYINISSYKCVSVYTHAHGDPSLK